MQRVMDNKSILVLHQCRPHEWDGDEAWAFKAAEKMRKQGFVVVRVHTEHWWELKLREPELFQQNVYSKEPNAGKQDLICTLNMTRETVPLAEKLQELLQEEKWQLTKDTVKRWKTEHGVDLYLPIQESGELSVEVMKDVFVVTESSSLIADKLTPLGLYRIFCYYNSPVVWIGFNQKEQVTGSKGVVGSFHGLKCLKATLERLLKCHIDQTYKAIIAGGLMVLCQRNHICFGVLPHRSGCNDLSKHLVQEMSQCEFSPTPEIPASKDEFPNLALDARNHLRIGLGIAQRVRHSSLNDLIGLRLWSYLCSEDDLKTDPSVVAKHEQLEKLVHDKQVVLAARRANKVMEKNSNERCKAEWNVRSA